MLNIAVHKISRELLIASKICCLTVQTFLNKLIIFAIPSNENMAAQIMKKYSGGVTYK